VRHQIRHRAGKSNLAAKTRCTAITFSPAKTGTVAITPAFTRSTRGARIKEVVVIPKRKPKQHHDLVGTWSFPPLEFGSGMVRKIPICHSLSAHIPAIFARIFALAASSSPAASKLNLTLVPSLSTKLEARKLGRPLAPRIAKRIRQISFTSRAGCTGDSSPGRCSRRKVKTPCWAVSRPASRLTSSPKRS